MADKKKQTITLLNQMVLNFEVYQLNEYIYSFNPSENYQKYMELDWIEDSLFNSLLQIDNIGNIKAVLNKFQVDFKNHLIFSIIIDITRMLNKIILNFEMYQYDEHIYSKNILKCYKKGMHVDWVQEA